MTRRRLSFEKENAQHCIPPKPELLLVVGPNGVLEFFTNRYIRIYVATKLTGLPDTIAADLAAEAYLEMRLPKRAQELYFPGNKQRVETVRLLRPSQEVTRRVELELVRECQTIMEERENASRK